MFRQLLDLMDAYDRRRATIVMLLTLVMALLDVVGVASIMPFMAVVADAKVVETNGMVSRAYHALGFTDPQRFLMALGIVVFVTLVASQVLKALGAYAQLRFALMREASLSERLMAGYLRQPYQWFLHRHSADLGNTIIGEVSQVVYGALMPMMVVIAQGIVLVALLALLVAVNVRLAVTAGAVLALAYGLVYALTSRRLGRMGVVRLEANSARVRTISEAFSGVKEIKVGGHEAAYLDGYRHWSRRFGGVQATMQTVTQLPRFALEAVAFGGMVLVVLILMAGSGELSSVLPVIALYAFAGYRLMPAAQQLYASVATLRSAAPVLAKLHGEMMALPRMPAAGNPSDTEPLPVRTAIVLDHVTYRYPGAPQPALRELCLRIPARQTVGLVGSSGSGKTTTVDVVLGLLEPEAGTLSVDGAPVTAALVRRWQRTIGYVPQQIYLADDTVAANIALGIPRDRIDRAAVERAARVANLHDFVATQLPQGYDTRVGERGVRLSGGQRQRIGIARALYHRPQVLILDEATSALDNLTEQAVMEAVYNLGGEITVIMIAHRLSTVRGATRIFQLHEGQVVAEGTFDELLAASETFRAMAAHDV
ncbi:MAG: ABC transporter ATP-binding protein/permease [Gemmatimonadetes bacterium]|nr:ABC transporter ATP-binding protein/permease [Gemmatimonadota bacterium]